MNAGSVALALLVAGAVATVILVVANVVVVGRKTNRLDKVLASYARNLGAGEAAELGVEAGPRFPALQRYFAATDERLAAAGIELPAQTWVGGAVAVAAVAALLGGLFFGSWLLGLAFGAASGYYLLNVLLASRTKSRAIRFATDLPQALAIIASGLRAGLTFPSALSATAVQDQGEVGNQLRRALAEVQFGSSIEEALRRVALRMSSADLEWLVLALEIQREVGGSLSGILDGVATTIKARSEIQREVRVISAEGRMSGYVLIALPICAFLALFVVRPEYVQYFWTDPIGFLMLGGAVALMAIGWIWMTKVVSVRV
jgi:tight adherence protein B